MSNTYRSEIARFREQQALEEEAARYALSGFAINARHDFIVARMQQAGERILSLIAEGKHDEALSMMNMENWGEEGEDSNEQVQTEPCANIATRLQ